MPQERPIPEVDAQMISSNSLDNGLANGLQINTANNLLLTDDVVATGPDLAAPAAPFVEQISSRISAQFSSAIASMQPMVDDVRSRGDAVYRKVESKTRQNPWLAIAATGVGALAIGFAIGRMLHAKREEAAMYNEEYPAGYDE